ncbi:MAG: hypothetical protein WC917_02460 [Bacilli bacterium]|jgi:hypothetical protein
MDGLTMELNSFFLSASVLEIKVFLTVGKVSKLGYFFLLMSEALMGLNPVTGEVFNGVEETSVGRVLLKLFTPGIGVGIAVFWETLEVPEVLTTLLRSLLLMSFFLIIWLLLKD